MIYSLGIGIGYIMTGMSESIGLNIAGFILGAGIGMSYQVLSINYMNKHIPSDKRATIISTGMMMRQGAVMLTNPLMGYGGDHNMSATLLIIGGLALLWCFISPLHEKDLIE